MKIQNTELYEALKNHTKAIIIFIDGKNKTGTLLTHTLEKKHVFHEDSQIFFQEDFQNIHYYMIIYKFREELEKTDEYNELLETINLDSEISKHLNKLVGTATQQRRLDEFSVCFGFPQKYLLRKGSLEFDEKIFNDEYERFENFFYSDYISFQLTALLNNFHLDSTSLKLCDGSEISKLSTDEIAKYLDYGPLSLNDTFSDGTKSYNDLPRFAIHKSLNVRKKIIEQDEKRDHKKGHEELMGFHYRFDALENTMKALRLFKPGDFSFNSFFTHSNGWFYYGLFSYSSQKIPSHQMNSYSLDKTEETEFNKLHGFYTGSDFNIAKYKYIQIAIDRLSYARERHRENDSLIDLLIAAEALFLSDAGKHKERGELRYRLALRSALFSDNQEKKKIFELFKYAYDVRSTIVHGGEVKGLPKDSAGKEMTLNDFVKKIEGLLRVSLLKAINLAANSKLPDDSLADWDALVFND